MKHPTKSDPTKPVDQPALAPAPAPALAPAAGSPRHAVGGFTLLEVMITVTIVAILTAIAIPSYGDYIRRSQRAEARAALVQAAQFMERVRTERNSYLPGGAAPTLPAGLTQVPASGATRYRISLLPTSTATRFTLQAQAVGAMANDRCGNLLLDHTGLRSFSATTTGTMDLCWQR